MVDMRLVECVPNFSEGRDKAVIDAIAESIQAVDGVTLLDVDPGAATNRTVITFIGEPEPVAEAAFQGARRAAELIDMRRHRGAHARMGAMDVCPFVPVSGVTMDDCVALARQVGARLGEELGIPIYLYEAAASRAERANLANVRKGEYEALEARLQDPEWAPDYGPAAHNARSGATAVGAREFLIAYNVNLNTRDRRLAHDIALDIREAGRAKRDEQGEIIRDADGKAVQKPGVLKEGKGVGWFIEEYGRAQISMNLTNYKVTSVHAVFDEICSQAQRRGLRVTGSEIVGLIPRDALLQSGRHYLARQGKTAGVPEPRLVEAAVQSLGLDDLKPFDPAERVVEYRVAASQPLVAMNLQEFADETSSDSPAPGGGSVAALLGSLAAALTAMVAALTHGKKGHEADYKEMDQVARAAQDHKAAFLRAIDEDTAAFDGVMDASRMPRKSEEQKQLRAAALEEANRGAVDVPLQVLRRSAEALPLIEAVATRGNPHSLSDAGVAGLALQAAAEGAYLNVRINLPGISDAQPVRDEADALLSQVRKGAEAIRLQVLEGLDG
jgi:glutamate formiminotransferase/formiminotetrahydrofolate cyclodeaminase